MLFIPLIGIVLVLLVRPKVRKRKGSAEGETFGVLIAARNEEANIALLLQDLVNQGFDEIVLVDDHSEDATRSIADSFPITVLSLDKGQGKKSAIGKGVEHLKTGYVVQFDADVRVGPQYLSALKQHVAGDG